MRARWLGLGWIVVAGVVWSGFYDVLMTRGTKEYFMRNALSRLGEAQVPSMAAIMAQTSSDAIVTASWWGGTVLVAGWLTIWLARRR